MERKRIKDRKLLEGILPEDVHIEAFETQKVDGLNDNSFIIHLTKNGKDLVGVSVTKEDYFIASKLESIVKPMIAALNYRS